MSIIASLLCSPARSQCVTLKLTNCLLQSDYDVFLSPLEDFKKKMEEAGLQDKVVYLDRKDKYRFSVK